MITCNLVLCIGLQKFNIYSLIFTFNMMALSSSVPFPLPLDFGVVNALPGLNGSSLTTRTSSMSGVDGCVPPGLVEDPTVIAEEQEEETGSAMLNWKKYVTSKYLC